MLNRIIALVALTWPVAFSQSTNPSTTVVTLQITSTSTVDIDNEIASCFGYQAIPAPTGEPTLYGWANATNVCDYYGPSPVPTLAAYVTSWVSAWSSWYSQNEVAITSWALAHEAYQSTASTVSPCASLYTDPANIALDLFTGTDFAPSYILDFTTYYDSICTSAWLAASSASNTALSSAITASITKSSARVTTSAVFSPIGASPTNTAIMGSTLVAPTASASVTVGSNAGQRCYTAKDVTTRLVQMTIAMVLVNIVMF